MAIAAMIAVWVTYTQLTKLVDANRQAAVVLVVQLETAMLEARNSMSETGRLIHTAPTSSDPKYASLLQIQMKEAKEAYLNLLDRYCACVRRKIVPEQEAKKDYRDQIREVVKSEEYKNFFGPATTYQNIQKLAEKWADEA